MKKRILCVVLALCLCLGMVGCSSGVSNEEYQKLLDENSRLKAQVESTQDDESSSRPLVSALEDGHSVVNSTPNSSELLSQLDITEYHCSSRFSHYAFLVIKNNSSYNLSISANVNFYNDNGDLVGAKSASQEAVESGYSTLLHFSSDEEFSTIKYDVDAEEESWYQCVLSDLSYDATVAKDKVIVSVTNNGENSADFVKVAVLFFKEETAVGFYETYAVDDNDELKPGKTISKECDCWEEFDSYKVFFSGRRD